MALKRPKKSKPPRKPKKTASNEAKENYIKRYNEWKQGEAKKEAAYKAALKKRETLDKRIAQI